MKAIKMLPILQGYRKNLKYQASKGLFLMLNCRTTSILNRTLACTYCDEAGHRSFKNIIYLTGPDLDQVARVKYSLDASFSPNEFVSEDASNNFAIETMAWGRFLMSAVVTDKNGQEFPKELAFQFKQKVLDAQSRGIPMISNC